jgi:hypothetical protein
MFRTWRTRRRRRSCRRSAQADTGRCGYERAGQASRRTRAERARTRNQSPSGPVRAAAALPLSTDPHSRRAAGVRPAAASCRRSRPALPAVRAPEHEVDPPGRRRCVTRRRPGKSPARATRPPNRRGHPELCRWSLESGNRPAREGLPVLCTAARGCGTRCCLVGAARPPSPARARRRVADDRRTAGRNRGRTEAASRSMKTPGPLS